MVQYERIIMAGAKFIMCKELRRVFSDKKLVFSLFILPVILVMGIFALMGKMISGMQTDVEGHVSNVYIKNAPDDFTEFVKNTDFFNNAYITFIDSSRDTSVYENAIKAGDKSCDLLVVFDLDFNGLVDSYKEKGDQIPEISVTYNANADYSAQAYESFVNEVLTPYRNMIISERIENVEELTVFNINEKMINDDRQASSHILSMIVPYLITFMLFAGAMSLGVDAITGEKERGTMASMLLAPIGRSQIALGKLSALAVLSAISAVIYTGSMVASVPVMMSAVGEAGISALNFSVSFSIGQIIMLLLTMVIMVLMYVALVSTVAVFAKSVKEAQTYMLPIYMAVLVAGLVTMYQGNIEKPLKLYAIPIYGNALFIQNVMLGTQSMAEFGISILSTFICSAFFILLLTKAFDSEKVMFNT
jgi:sodium transport system permease protein